MKKRILSMLMSVIMVLNMVPINVGAIEMPSFAATSVETYAGNTVDVAISGNNLADLGSFDLEIYYDSTAMSVKSTSTGYLAGDAILDTNTDTAGVIKVSAISLAGITGSGTFMNIRFAVNTDCAAGDYPVAVTVGDAYDTSLNTAAISGGKGVVCVQKREESKKTFSLYTNATPTSVSKGDTVTYKINNSNGYSFASGNFAINYDAEILQLDKVVLNSNLTVEGAVYDINTSLLGQARVSIASNVELSSYELMTATFTVIADDNVETSISATASDVYADDLSEYIGSSYSRTIYVSKLPEITDYPDLYLKNIQDMVAGEEYAVTLHLEKDAAVAAADFAISYDTAVFECITVSPSAKTSEKGAMVVINDNIHEGNIRFSYVNTSGYADGIDIVDVVFRVKSAPQEHYGIALSGTGVKTTEYKDIQLEYVTATSCIYAKAATAPTCTEQGYTTYTCSCGKSYVQDYVDALGHTEEILKKVDSTCSATGLTEGLWCSVCETVFTAQEIIPKLPHTDGEVVVENNVLPTCTTDGGYDNVTYCTVCEAETSRESVVVGELGHKPGQVVEENNFAPTCTAVGGFDNVRYCTVCSAEISRNHIVIDALGHTDGEVVVENNVLPTCTTDGGYDNVTYCTVCKAETSRVHVVTDMLGHTVVEDEEVLPSCTVTGLTEGKHCSVCNKVFVAQEIVDATGHKGGFATTTQKAVCDICGEEYGDYSPSNAIASGICGDSLTWTLTTDNVLVISGSGKMYDFRDPYYEGYIGTEYEIEILKPERPWIVYSDSIMDIVIEEGVTSISEFAFFVMTEEGETGYPNILNLTLPSTITLIGSHAFGRLANLKSINIPEGIKKIGGSTFWECTSLEEIHIPGSLVTIAHHTFSECTSLKSVNISEGITEIGYDAFSYCSSLESIEMPKSMVFIDENAFYKCSTLKDVYYRGTSEQWKEISIRTPNECLTSARIFFNTCNNEHNWSEASCERRQHCSECSAERGEALGHNHEATVTTPTCTEKGYTTYDCTRCDDSYVVDYVDALGHTDGVPQTENRVEPSCTEKGYYDSVVYCTVCDAELSRETIEIPENGHSYKGVVTAPDCDEKGYTTYTCSVCGDEYISDYVDALGHTDGEVVTENNVLPTCTTAGSYDNVTYCTVCEVETSREHIAVEKLGHSFTNYISDGDATCTEDGHETAKCDRCDVTDRRTEEDSALSHDYKSTVTPPTCTEKGYTTYDCTRCKDSYVADYVDALGHTDGEIVTENNVLPTCTTAGSYDNVTYCTVCEVETSREHIAVEKLGHSFTNYISDGDATCTEDGHETAKCDRCDVTDRRTEEDSALSHDYKSTVTPPTCTEKGYTTYDCTRCDDSYVADYVDALGHTDGTIVVESNVLPTCTANGSYDNVTYCIVCKVETSRKHIVVDALGHEYSEYTSNGDGTRTRECYRCKETFTEKIIIASGECGPDANWELLDCNDDGIGDKLIISGFGVMTVNPWVRYAEDIKTVVIEEGITSICNEAFKNCNSFAEIVIPESIEFIEFEAFAFCSSLKEVIVPDGITSIENYTFRDCTSLEKITLPDGIVDIGLYAFYNCRALRKIKIPESVTKIYEGAFKYCLSLENIIIPKNVSYIGDCTFQTCTSLKSITIPKEIDDIRQFVFEKCDDLEYVFYTGTIEQWKNVSVGNYNGPLRYAEIFYNACEGEHNWADATCVEGIKCILCNAVIGDPLGHTEIIDPAISPTCTESGLTEGKHCSVCNEIIVEQQVVPASHTLTEYTLNGDGTKTSKCDVCGEEVTVNDAVHEGEAGENITWFIDSANVLRINGEGEMSPDLLWDEFADTVEKIEISEGITTICDNAFNGFENLKKINIPDSVTDIGANAFDNISSEAKIFIQSNNYAVEYFNGNNNVNVIMPPAEDAVITLDKDYIVAIVGENTEIKAECTHPTPFKWFIEGEIGNVEYTVDGNTCIITGVTPGTCYVVASATFGDETIYERCRVDVTEAEPNVTINGVHLPATSVTTNIYSTKYPTFDILFDLEQNMMPVATFSLRGGLGGMSAENNGVAVDSAYFADSATAAMFGLELMDDRTMAVVPLFDVTDAAVVKTVKSSYSSKVTVVVNGEEFTTAETLALKVTKKLPTVKTTAVKLNSFYAADTAPLVITSANETVLSAEVDYSETTAKVPAIPEWLVFNDDMTVSLANGFIGKASGKVYLKVWIDGYTAPVSTTVSVTAANTAPKLKLSAASATLNTYRDKAVETQITLLSNDKKVAFDTIGVTDVKVADVSLMDAKNAKTYAASANYTVESYNAETGVIVLDVAENCEAKAGKILLEAYVEGALNPVQLPFTVSVYNKAPTFKISKTSAAISTMEATETSTLEIGVVPTPADYKVTAENFSWTITDSKNKAFDVAPLDIALNGNKVTVSANSSTEAGAKYKVTFNLADCAKAAVLNVTVTKPAFKLAKTSVTVSPLAAAETFKTEIVVTPTPKDYVLTNNNFTWVITDAKNNVFAEAPLNVSFDDSNNTVTVASNAKSVPGGKYKVVFTMEGVEKPVTLNVTVANPTVKLAKTSLTLNVLNGDSAKVAVTPTPKDYVLTDTNFEWKITDSKNNVLEPAPLDISLEDNTVTVSTNGNTRMGQTYKVVYTLKETNKTVTMTVKTLAEKSSKVTLTLSAKGKQETGKLQNGVTITPKWTNLLRDVDITENIKVYATAIAKGSVPVDVTDKFDVARNADGTYTIRFAGFNAMNSLNFKDKYTVTAEDIAIGTQNVSTAKALSMSVTHTKPKVTQSVKEVKLYQNDRYSRGKVRITLNDSTMPKIVAVQIADGGISEFYELVNLGGGWYGIEYKDNTIAPNIKAGTIKLNVFLQGNNPANNNPNATVSVKVTNVKFK